MTDREKTDVEPLRTLKFQKEPITWEEGFFDDDRACTAVLEALKRRLQLVVMKGERLQAEVGEKEKTFGVEELHRLALDVTKGVLDWRISDYRELENDIESVLEDDEGINLTYPPSRKTSSVSSQMNAKNFPLRRDFAPDLPRGKAGEAWGDAVGHSLWRRPEDTPGVSPRDLHFQIKNRLLKSLGWLIKSESSLKDLPNEKEIDQPMATIVTEVEAMRQNQQRQKGILDQWELAAVNRAYEHLMEKWGPPRGNLSGEELTRRIEKNRPVDV